MGNGFDIPALAEQYHKIAVVGGGIGTAPMFQLTRELAAAGVKPDVFFGFRDTPYCMEEYREIANLVKVSTDTGAVGFHGFVTQLYDPADYDVVLVCGPTVMMRNAARLCAEKGTPCFVSMEKKMACGIGACLGCTCRTKVGAKTVCKDGPVFKAEEVFDDGRPSRKSVWQAAGRPGHCRFRHLGFGPEYAGIEDLRVLGAFPAKA